MLHFLVALAALLAFGYVAYLFCMWLQLADYRLWSWYSWVVQPGPGPVFRSRNMNSVFVGLIRICASLSFAASALVISAFWIGWLRRRILTVRLRHLRLPALFVVGSLVIVNSCTFVLMHLYGRSSLEHAVYRKFEKRVSFLLYLGADPYAGYPSAFDLAYRSHNYDLAISILNQKQPMVSQASSLLYEIAGFSGRPTFKDDGTAIPASELPGFKRLVKRLMDGGADPNLFIGYGFLPLHQAAKGGSIESMKLLLANGAVADASDYEGLTALHHAADSEDAKSIQFLLDQGLDVNSKDNQGLTPLDHATLSVLFSDGQDAIKILKSHGAVLGNASSIESASH